MIAVSVAAVAFLVAVGALVLAGFVARQSGELSGELRRHRLGHQRRDGAPDPAPPSNRHERREVNLGAPRGVGERRTTAGQLPLVEEPPTGPLAPPTVQARRVLPRPGQIGER